MKVKSLCGFYANESHLATMLLPYISKKIQNGAQIETILKNGIENNINEVLNNINIEKELKNKITNVNWTETKDCNFEKKINDMSQTNSELEILVNGEKEEIEKINEKIYSYIRNNNVEEKNVNIINLYSMKEFENVNTILDKHDAILNTSGEHKIEDVFKEYNRKSNIRVVNE